MIEVSLDEAKSQYTLSKDGKEFSIYRDYAENEYVTNEILCKLIKSCFGEEEVDVTLDELFDVVSFIRPPQQPEGYDDFVFEIDDMGWQAVYHHKSEYEHLNFFIVSHELKKLIESLYKLGEAAEKFVAVLEGLQKQFDKPKYNNFAGEAQKLPGVDWKVKCPACPSDVKSTSRIYGQIQHLNDSHMWTRERIAEWLETLHDPTGANGPNLNFTVKEVKDEDF